MRIIFIFAFIICIVFPSLALLKSFPKIFFILYGISGLLFILIKIFKNPSDISDKKTKELNDKVEKVVDDNYKIIKKNK